MQYKAIPSFDRLFEDEILVRYRYKYPPAKPAVFQRNPRADDIRPYRAADIHGGRNHPALLRDTEYL
jgi:hypothetical protein